MTTTLFEHTRKHVEKMMQDVTGDEDFLPIMAVRDHKGDLIACGLLMPDEGQEKDMMAWTMSAICALHRATEVAFTSAAWIVIRKDKEPMPDMPPSECPDRQEVAMITMVDADGKGFLHTAPIIRENNMAGVGMWEDCTPKSGNVMTAGRFYDAICIGVGMGQSMPSDLAAYLDEEIAAGRSERLIHMMVKKFQMLNQDGGVQN